MSLNSAISQEYVVQTKALLSLLEQYVTRWSNITTLEDKLLLESEAISTFERLLNQDFYLNLVEPGIHPDINDMGRVYLDYEYLLRLNSAKLQKLTEMFLNRFNSQQLSLMELTGIMKRIRQKRSSLALWTRDKAKYVVSDHFLNFDALDSRFTSVTECDVDTNQGILTLPVRNKILHVPSSARIGPSSNGVAGNSDKDVQVNNRNPMFAINKDDGNWFEYERLDAGPVDLNLTIEFPQPKVINHLSIEPVNLGLSLPYEIIDITFSTSGTVETSIHDLLSSEFDDDFFTVKTVGNDISWAISFLPVQASVVTLKLRQRQSYSINTVTGDNRSVQRKRWAIAIKDISLYRIEYAAAGGINSKVLDLPSGLYSGVPFADVWPQNSSFYTEYLEVSFDGGQTWTATNLPLTLGSDSSTFLMNGTESSFLWRVSLERNDEAFSSLTSFTEELDPLAATTSIQRSVSRFQSPTEITLPNTPKDGRVFVLQPKLARRGDKYRGIYLGDGGGQEVNFELPFDLLKHGIYPDEVRIFVARREYVRVQDNTIIGANQWAFSDDFKEIIFGSALPAGSKVRMVLKEEQMLLEQRSDGYYHQTKLLFDPDKENIVVKYLPRENLRETVILPRNQTVIPLNKTNILDDSFVITSTNGTTYTEVTSKASVLDASDGDYYVDYLNGVLYLAQEFGADTPKATYLHQSEVELSKDDFEVVLVDNKPWGIRINKDAFVAHRTTETFGSSPSKVVSVIDGSYRIRTDSFVSATNTKTLTYDSIVRGTLSVGDTLLNTSVPPEEVSYQDGHTEFLGLIPMNTEETIEQESGALTYVTFTLASGGLWYSTMGVVFGNATVFANEVSDAALARTGSVGDYHIASDGLVTVNIGVGGTLASGISINYYYRDPSFDPVNKYSVDYKNGILYTNTAADTNATIDYRAASYKVSYDIAEEVDSYEYNSSSNVVSIRTEGLRDINNLVKVIWTKAPVTSELLSLREFFSPLISVLAFRFN